jgi:hypothetical protein
LDETLIHSCGLKDNPMHILKTIGEYGEETPVILFFFEFFIKTFFKNFLQNLFTNTFFKKTFTNFLQNHFTKRFYKLKLFA